MNCPCSSLAVCERCAALGSTPTGTRRRRWAFALDAGALALNAAGRCTFSHRHAARLAFGGCASSTAWRSAVQHSEQVLPPARRAPQRVVPADQDPAHRSCVRCPSPAQLFALRANSLTACACSRLPLTLPHTRVCAAAERRQREQEYALLDKAKSTKEWQLLAAEVEAARRQIERHHALRETAKAAARVRDECNVDIARARHEIRQRHFRQWEQRGLPISHLFPSDEGALEQEE